MTTSSLPDDAQTDGLSRRTVLQRTAVGGVGLALSGSLGLLFSGPATAAGKVGGYGELIADPDGILALPEGFSYEIVAHSGKTTMESGQPTPADFDGMAAFVRQGGPGTVLVANHEISGSEQPPVPPIPEYTYNPAVFGGTTNIEVDKNGRRVREYVSLAGTLNNCAGGKSPWNTWLTCEESEQTRSGIQHGWVFEVDPYDQRRNRDPKPIKALGRFAHESVAVDPETGVIYETEDAGNPNGLFFRWTPPADALPLTKGSLRELDDLAGTLEAMRATRNGSFVNDLSPARVIGTTYDVEWIDVPDRLAKTVSIRKQEFAKEVTRARKLEGMWWGDGGTYFVCSFARTSDGSLSQHDGQVWFFDPAKQTIELKIHFEYTPDDQNSDPDGPDNITVSPFGGVILAEDGDGVQHLVGSTESGNTFFLARNDLNDKEFAGPTFSHDKKTLFAAIQSPGIVFAITGPWKGKKR